MAEIETPSFLHWLSGSKGAELALRLKCWSSAILPKDPVLNNQQEQLIIAELIEFAVHARRAFELWGQGAITISNDNNWPRSYLSYECIETDFRKAVNGIIHSNKLQIGWEYPELEPEPYGGAVYAGHFKFCTNRFQGKVWMGGIANAYMLGFMNNLSNNDGM